jgi:hypothetical protein
MSETSGSSCCTSKKPDVRTGRVASKSFVDAKVVGAHLNSRCCTPSTTSDQLAVTIQPRTTTIPLASDAAPGIEPRCADTRAALAKGLALLNSRVHPPPTDLVVVLCHFVI